MIKVQFVISTAFLTFPTIPLPNIQLYRRRNYSAPLNVDMNRLRKIVIPFYRDKRELEHDAMLISFRPRID